jgi:hypothetical protein
MRKRKDPNVWFKEARMVADDPVASDWLKNALFKAINRDPVAAAKDAEVLTRILQQRAAAVEQGTISNGSSRPSKTVS